MPKSFLMTKIDQVMIGSAQECFLLHFQSSSHALLTHYILIASHSQMLHQQVLSIIIIRRRESPLHVVRTLLIFPGSFQKKSVKYSICPCLYLFHDDCARPRLQRSLQSSDIFEIRLKDILEK